MIWKLLIFILMTAVIVLSFTTPAPQQAIGEASRIMYYHVPMAWISVLAFAMSMVYSIQYLRGRQLSYDERALDAARLGFVFCVLAAISGSVFARVAWGSFWNWDPRETSIFVLLLIYGAYFALRGAVEEEDRRAALTAVYSIFAFLTVPFLVFVMPRIMPSLHPADSVVDATISITMGPTVGLILLASLVLFTSLFLWVFYIAVRIRRLQRSDLKKED